MQNRLLDAISHDRAPHAILISGPEGSGKRELARRCAALFCLDEDAPERLVNCPNYYEIGESTVKVDDIRTLLASAAMQGFNGGRRAFVFVNAQLMSTQIQNTLLKTLEEPHSETMLILTGNEFGLLPTIRSRCVIERLGAGSVEETARELMREGMSSLDARFFAGLSDGILSRARTGIRRGCAGGDGRGGIRDRFPAQTRGTARKRRGHHDARPELRKGRRRVSRLPAED